MAKLSAGILLFRKLGQIHEVLLVHPGGPFWERKDNGAWSILKGEYAKGEDPLAAAQREFGEEMGAPAPAGDYRDLGDAKQSSSKVIHVFALNHNFSLERFRSNTFEMEWPPRSGQKQEFPEADKAAWFPLATASQKLVKGQVIFVDRLAEFLDVAVQSEPESGQQQTQLL